MTPPVSGYSGWWDASQITGVSDGAALATWPDLSGGGHNLTQNTAADKPTFYSSTASKLVNGLPAVWFDGTDDFMTASGIAISAQPLSMIGVFKDSTQEQNVMLMAVGAPDSSGVGTGFFELFANSPGAGYFGYAGGGGDFPEFGTLTPNLTVLGFVFNGSSSVGFQDGAATTGLTASTSAGTGLSVGHYSSGSNPFYNGPICELLVYPSALTAANLASLYSYFQGKWWPQAPSSGLLEIAGVV